MKGVYVRRMTGAVLAVVLLCSAGWAVAQEARGLGSSWPVAADQSRSPYFHAYRWDRPGVAFIQLNDQSGAPVMAIAVGQGGALVLPIGHADKVRLIPSDSAGAVSAATGPVLYSDDAVQISGAGDLYEVRYLQAAAMKEPCTDPVECGKPMTASKSLLSAPPAAMAADETCNDPVECGKPLQ